MSTKNTLGWGLRLGWLLMGIGMLGLGLRPLLRAQSHYETYWGGAAFVPVVLLIGGTILFVGIFRWEKINNRVPSRKKRSHH